MAGSGSRTGGTGVVFIEPQSMSPAIEDLRAVIGNSWSRLGRRRDGGGSDRWPNRRSGRGIGAMKSTGAGGAGLEAAKTFFVGVVEQSLEFSVGTLGGSASKPRFTSMGKDTTGLEQQVSEFDESGVRNGLLGKRGDALDFTEPTPKQLKRLGRCPQGCDACPILFEVSACQRAVGVLEMGNHIGDGNSGKSKCGILNGGEVEAVDGRQNLSLEFLAEGGSASKFFDGGFVNTNLFGDFKLGGPSCRGSGGFAGVGGECEGYATSEIAIGNIRQDKAQVAMGTATTNGRDGAGIGNNLASKDLDGGVIGSPDQLS